LCFAAFSVSFCLLVFADSDQGQGEMLPKFTLTTSPRGSIGWVTNPLLPLLVYFNYLFLFQHFCIIQYKYYIAYTLGVWLAKPTPQYRWASLGLLSSSFFLFCPTCPQDKVVWPHNNNNFIFVFQPSLANNGRLASTLAIVSGLLQYFYFISIA